VEPPRRLAYFSCSRRAAARRTHLSPEQTSTPGPVPAPEARWVRAARAAVGVTRAVSLVGEVRADQPEALAEARAGAAAEGVAVEGGTVARAGTRVWRGRAASRAGWVGVDAGGRAAGGASVEVREPGVSRALEEGQVPAAVRAPEVLRALRLTRVC